MKSYLLASLLLLLSASSYAQSGFEEFDIEAEVNAAEGKVGNPPPSSESVLPSTQGVSKPKSQGPTVEQELKVQEEVVERKVRDEGVISEDRNLDRYPRQEPVFVKPKGPKQGGTLRVEHPRAADGLIRINRDGSYQFKTPTKEKSKSSSVKFGMMTPPKITGANSTITYESMYGDENVFAVDFDYVWQPFRNFGALGLRLGTGIATASGEGFFRTARQDSLGNSISRAQESYSLFIVPLSVFLEYRFEYMRKQWVVPYVTGGGTYYGMAEVRDDGASPTFAGAPAVGGGGGLLISISRLDPAGAFTLSQEYGIADMWFVLEARAMQGLNEDLDFSNQSVSAGIAVDF